MPWATGERRDNDRPPPSKEHLEMLQKELRLEADLLGMSAPREVLATVEHEVGLTAEQRARRRAMVIEMWRSEGSVVSRCCRA